MHKKSANPIQSPTLRKGVDVLCLARLCLFFMLFSIVAGCAHRQKTTPPLLRALPPLLLELPSTLSPMADEVNWSGVVVRHASVIGPNKEHYLSILPSENVKPVTIRYGLSTGARMPIEKGETITIKIFGASKDSPEKEGAGLAVFDESGSPRAFVSEKGGLPETVYKTFFRIKPGKNSVYLESKPIDGICNAVIDHRNLWVFHPRSKEGYSFHPGTSQTLPTAAGSFDFTVVDHGVAIDTNCAHRNLDRLSFIGLKSLEGEAASPANPKGN